MKVTHPTTVIELDPDELAVLKALLVHGSAWLGDVASDLGYKDWDQARPHVEPVLANFREQLNVRT